MSDDDGYYDDFGGEDVDEEVASSQNIPPFEQLLETETMKVLDGDGDGENGGENYGENDLRWLVFDSNPIPFHFQSLPLQ